jgi:alginate O-acetyltransferase complex protein AlgJ
MGLISGYRRPWIIVLLALLATPMVAHIIASRDTVSEGEARVLTPMPVWPRSIADWSEWPRQFDRFLVDHFGFRNQLISAYGALKYAFFSPVSHDVLYGRDNWLFYNGDSAIEQSGGLVIRNGRVDKFADFAARLAARLRRKNIAFLVTSPPNTATIVRHKLPSWAEAKPLVSEYDLVMQALAARRVAALDLRPALAAANRMFPIYRRTDSHWNRLGALIAYNEVVAALGHLDWSIDARVALRGFIPTRGGDLARLLSISTLVEDMEASLDLSASPQRFAQAAAREQIADSEKTGTAVLVIGDSFTNDSFWRAFFDRHASRYEFTSHGGCGFDAAIIDRFNPDIVVLAVTERYLFCP